MIIDSEKNRELLVKFCTEKLGLEYPFMRKELDGIIRMCVDDALNLYKDNYSEWTSTGDNMAEANTIVYKKVRSEVRVKMESMLVMKRELKFTERETFQQEEAMSTVYAREPIVFDRD